jgi:carboxyl-terminal processing protease
MKALLTAAVVLLLAAFPAVRAADAPGPVIGIGTELESAGGHAVVAAVLPDSPADKSGVKAGDRLVKVDGRNVDGLSLLAISHLLHGARNSAVRLTIDRGGRQRDFDMKREVLWLPGPNAP